VHSFVLHHVQDDSIFTGKSVWTALEEESLLEAMDMYSFGNWYRPFSAVLFISDILLDFFKSCFHVGSWCLSNTEH